MQDKKPNPLIDLLINIIIPSVILMKLSGEDNLGTVGALILALAFPVLYGGYDLLKNKKFNFIALLGFISVLLTGGIALLELDTQWLAIKEAAIPGIIGIGVLISAFTPYAVVNKMLYNDAILDTAKINQVLSERNKQQEFEKILTRSNFLFAGTFAFSSVMNYILATWIVTSPAGTEAFNEELGRLTLFSYPVIAIPSMLMMFSIFFLLWRSIRKLTGLSADEILKVK